MPVIKTAEELTGQLAKIGYPGVKVKTKKAVIIQLPKGGDREGALRDVDKKLNGYGARYNPKGGSSSVGRTELTGGFTVECKLVGGGGSGAGSDLTRLTESAQCVYNAALYKKLTYTHADLKKAGPSYQVDEPINNILTKLPDDWVTSSKITAATLKKNFPPAGKSYIHHRGSRWVGALEQHWKGLNLAAGKPFANLNKWSPADIWLISAHGSTIPVTNTETLVELNNLLIQAIKDKHIVGVSLKKVKGIANFGFLNLSSDRKLYSFEKTTTGLRGFFLSGDGYMFFNGGKAQFRTFGTTWQGELKGKNANMGKMSGGPIKGLIDNITGGNFIKQRDLTNRNCEDTQEKFYTWYTACPDTPKMTKEHFLKEAEKKDDNWWISKIMTAQLISVIESLSAKDKDRFSSGMVNYAGSESELSGPYCKVY